MAYYNGKEIGICVNVGPNALTNEMNLFPSQIVDGFVENLDLGGVYTVMSDAPFVLNEGEIYYVKWDNSKEFTCVSKSITDTLTPYVYIGNGSALGYTGNEEPFCICYNADTNTVIFVAIDDTHEIHRVRIYQKWSVVKVKPLSAEQNDVYTAPEGEAYSPVTVNVPGGTEVEVVFATDEEVESILNEIFGV